MDEVEAVVRLYRLHPLEARQVAVERHPGGPHRARQDRRARVGEDDLQRVVLEIETTELGNQIGDASEAIVNRDGA